jgi:hypothetical protein
MFFCLPRLVSLVACSHTPPLWPQRIVHLDVAARNCLLHNDVAQIADFGKDSSHTLRNRVLVCFLGFMVVCGGGCVDVWVGEFVAQPTCMQALRDPLKRASPTSACASPSSYPSDGLPQRPLVHPLSCSRNHQTFGALPSPCTSCLRELVWSSVATGGGFG